MYRNGILELRIQQEFKLAKARPETILTLSEVVEVQSVTLQDVLEATLTDV